jgi:hypothetical protein
MGAQDLIVERNEFGAGWADSLSHVITRADRTVLAHILLPGINLAIWERSVPRAIVRWLRETSLSDLQSRFQDLDFKAPAACIGALLSARMPSRTSREQAAKIALVNDVADLASVTTKIARVTSVRIRLEWVTEQPCSYFHTDKVPLRLVCTYRGSGTEWLSDEAAKRLTAPDDVPAQNEINRLTAGDVAVMLGSPYGSTIGTALTHRSPPVNSSSEWRLFLAIDPVPPGIAGR